MNLWPSLIAIAFASASLLSAQELSHTTAPRVLSKVDALYPDRARLLHLEGDVILRVIVGTDGLARNPRVIGVYIGPDLEQSAIDAVQKWRFAPATKDGQPVEMPAQVEVNFRIPNKLAGELNTTIGERQIFAWKRMACKFSPSWILGWPKALRTPRPRSLSVYRKRVSPTTFES